MCRLDLFEDCKVGSRLGLGNEFNMALSVMTGFVEILLCCGCCCRITLEDNGPKLLATNGFAEVINVVKEPSAVIFFIII